MIKSDIRNKVCLVSFQWLKPEMESKETKNKAL